MIIPNLNIRKIIYRGTLDKFANANPIQRKLINMFAAVVLHNDNNMTALTRSISGYQTLYEVVREQVRAFEVHWNDQAILADPRHVLTLYPAVRKD